MSHYVLKLHQFKLFYDNFNKKILVIFLVKFIIRNSCEKFYALSRRNSSYIFPPVHFQDKIVHIFFLQKEVVRNKNVELLTFIEISLDPARIICNG